MAGQAETSKKAKSNQQATSKQQQQSSLSETSTPSTQELVNSEGFRKKTANLVEERLGDAQIQLEKKMRIALEEFSSTVSDTARQVRSSVETSIETDKSEGSHRKMFFDEKIFSFQNSPLSDLFRIADYRTLYNIMVAIFVALAFNLILCDYFDKGELFDLETLYWCFSGFSHIILPYFMITGVAYAVIPLVKWIVANKISRYIWIPVYTIYILAILTIGCATCVIYKLGMCSAFIIQCEMARISMKMHSYLRNKLLYCTDNEYKGLIPVEFKAKGIDSNKIFQPKFEISDLWTEIKRFSFFFVAPTLLYRDSYPKASKRSLRLAASHFLNFFLCIYFGFILFKTFCKDQISLLANNFNTAQFVQCLFKLMMPSTLSILLLFFGLLHSWFNGFAELLKFPDRSFYQDWWNSVEFGTYYRKWNIVVHEFLFYYAYGDTVRFTKGKAGRGAGMFVSFAVSAIIHEVILSFVIGYFYPILLIIFTGPGIILIRYNKAYASKNFNIAFWLMMFVGTSLIITLYLTESFARTIVDEQIIHNRWGNLSWIVPRTLYINISKNS